ncbi:MAG: hypothetical protein KF752_14255 [Pirellulaceae bacterium]|nr:hypothetical protein [Pirellulaceae bacterium]
MTSESDSSASAFIGTRPLPAAIQSRLAETRGLLRTYLCWQWLLMVVMWLLLVFWIGAAIDYLPVRVGASESPTAVRIALLGLMVAGAVWLSARWLLPRWLTRVDDASLALLVERQHPELNNTLITAVQLSHREVREINPQAHAEMLHRAVGLAERSIRHVQPDQLFNWRPIRRLRAVVGLSMLLTLLATVFSWEWMSLWGSRLFALSDQPWPRSAVLRVDWLQLPIPSFTGQLSAQQSKIVFDNQVARIPSGASPLLQVSADANAPRIPEVCTLYYRGADSTRGRANMRRIGVPIEGWQHFTLDGPPLDGLSHSLSIDVVGLDTRLRNLQLEVVDRTVVTEMFLECVYPGYLMDSLSLRAPRETLLYRAGLKLPEGTDCTLIGHCNARLGQVQYALRQSESIDALESPEIMTASSNDHSFRISLGPVRQNLQMELLLQDHYGLYAEQIMRYTIAVLSDTKPDVQSRLEGIGLAITPQAVLPVRGQVTDDHGVAQVSAELSVDETLLEPVPLRLEADQLAGEVDFQALAQQGTLRLQPGSTVGLCVQATDYYNLDDLPHAGRGQPQQLAVVTPDQLLVILDRQELELRQRLEQIIDELQQLQQALSGLSEATDSQPVATLRAQQSQLQSDKSRQELAGIASRTQNVRLQLRNNRIDSLDRQQRLLEKVEQPLGQLLADQYSQLDRAMIELQSAVAADRGQPVAVAALTWLEKILIALEEIKSSMLDLESFNEIIDLVRGLLDEQERLLKETEETQKARILDLFK